MKKSANRQAWLYEGSHWSFTPLYPSSCKASEGQRHTGGFILLSAELYFPKAWGARGSRIMMAVFSSPWNPATHHRLETQAYLLHSPPPQKELSLLPPTLSDNLFPTGSCLQLLQEQP